LGLHGFDPDVNRRLGCFYEVRDAERGSAFVTVGREFPYIEDPSIWPTLELRDETPAPSLAPASKTSRSSPKSRATRKSSSSRAKSESN
jgi:hypothetical protein